MPRPFTCTTPPPTGGDPTPTDTPVATLPLPVYTRIGGDEIQVGTIELDVIAGEPITDEDGAVRVPLTVKGHDWGEVIVTQ